MAACNIMLAIGWFETINDMVRLLHPIRLRQVTIIKKVFIQKSKMAEKKTKIVYKYIIKNKIFRII